MAARMREYVAHRQMLPLIALLISASLGAGLFYSSAAADMIWPDWQYPHCGTCSSIHAACTALPAGLCNPSIVVIFRPATDASVVTHDRTGWPSRCTVQAPHIAIPHPNFVPVRRALSRIAQRSGMSGSASRVVVFSLSKNVVGIGDSAG